jgi:hypothetical protein
MTKTLHKLGLFLALFLAFWGGNGYGQNAMVGDGFAGGNWGGACNSSNNFVDFSPGAGSSFTSGVLTSSQTGNRYWRIAINSSGTIKQLPTSTGSDFEVTANETYTAGDGCTTTGAYFIDVQKTTNRYIIKTEGAGTNPSRKFVVFEIDGTPVTVTSVTNPGATCPGVESIVTATLSADLPKGQDVYLRYSTDNFATSTVQEMKVNQTTCTSTIPATTNISGKTVKYYVFTSGNDKLNGNGNGNVAANGSNADFYTINLNGTSLAPYSYNVTSAPAQPGPISGTTAQCPLGSQVYSVTTVSGATSYTWTVPNGWSITSGQGTNSITATAGIIGQNGDISVVANNTCGSSATKQLAVTVVAPTTTPTVNIAITSGASTSCSGSNVTFTATHTNTGGGTVTYNFKKGGVSVQSGASATYTTNTLANADTITCDISISGGTCLTANTAASNTITMTINTSHAISLSSGVGTNSPTVCKDIPITPITFSVSGGATGAGVTGLPTGITGSYVGGVFTISGTPTVSGTFDYTVTTTGNTCTAVTATGTITVRALYSYLKVLQATTSACLGVSPTITAEAYAAGITEGVGQATGTTAEIGYSSTNSNPSSASGWTWIAATFLGQSGNNDQFTASLGTSLTAGTYYYAYRFKIAGNCNYQYAGTNGIWNTTTDNGALAVTVPSISNPTSNSITSTSAVLGATINSIGCSAGIERGFYYSTTNNFADGTGTKVVVSGFSTGAFTQVITGLTEGTTYYYKGFATNSSGTAYTFQGSFSTPTPAIDRDPNDGNYDPSALNASGIFESYMGVLVKDASGNPISGLNRVFDMDGALGSKNSTNFNFGTQNPGLSFNVGTEAKIFTKGMHKDCGCSSWYYVYKSTDPDPLATDFPLPASGSLFTNQINGKFTLLNYSKRVNETTTTGTFARTTGESAVGTTSDGTYNNSLTNASVNKIKYKDYTDGTVGTVSVINPPVNPVLCPTCSGDYKVAIAMLAWVSTTGDCNDAASLIYHRDINQNKITNSGVVLNPHHPDAPTAGGSINKNSLDGTKLFYISQVKIEATGETTWNGSAWSHGLPDKSKNVFINGTYSTAANGSFSCNDMTVAAGVKVTINNGGHIEALNTVTTPETEQIVIEHSGNFVQRCDEKKGLAKIEHTKITRQMKYKDYVYWGSPVQENIISQFPTANFDKKYRWQSGIEIAEGNWITLEETKPAEGFITRILTKDTNVPVKITGTANNGIITTPVKNYERFTTDTKLNYLHYALIGNPYPCAIDAKAFLSNPNNDAIESTLYFWTSFTRSKEFIYVPDDKTYKFNYNPADYASWNFTGGVGTVAKSIRDETGSTEFLVPSGKIASGQSFFVEVKKDGNVYFDNSMRLIGDNNTQFFKTKPTSKEQSSAKTTNSAQLEEGRIWLNVSNEGNFRQLLLGYVNGATNNFEPRYDGIVNTESPISIYTLVDNKDLVIQGRQLPFDQNETVPVGYETSIAGDFYFDIDDVDGFFNTQNIYLKDNLLGTTHDLKQNAYLFSTGIGRFDNRFELAFINKTLGINQPALDTESVIFSTTKDQIKINSTTENIISATVYDLTGKKLVSKNNLNNSKIILDKPTKQAGVFIVKVKLENNKEISKKVVF